MYISITIYLKQALCSRLEQQEFDRISSAQSQCEAKET